MPWRAFPNLGIPTYSRLVVQSVTVLIRVMEVERFANPLINFTGCLVGVVSELDVCLNRPSSEFRSWWSRYPHFC